MATNPNRFSQSQVIPFGRYEPDPNECPNCHSMPGLIAGGCHRCQNTGRIRPSPRDPTSRPLEMPFDAAYAAHPAGVMHSSANEWRVYVEPSSVPGRHDIWLQDKIHPANEYKRVCVYHHCKYADIRLFLLHLACGEALNALRADAWRPRPF